MRHGLLVCTALALVLGVGTGRIAAQDAPVADAAAANAPDAVVTEQTAADAADEVALSDDELDELVAPVALYPDSLLTQVLVASTYPIDVMKADRFVTAKADLSDKDRKTAAEAEDWDPSVQVLAGGFPTVVQKMAAEIDWTQQLGDAMLAQSDDVLDAVQRQRARAVAVGNLSSNEAQVVDQADDTISIDSAQPDVVYVPQYDASTAYTTPYTAPPVVATAATGYSTSNLLTTGAIAFGSALLVNEIFDDDDDWDDYWHHGSSNIDWDNADIHPRPNIDVNGDVNIDRNRNNIVAGGDRTNIDRANLDRTKVNGDRIGTSDPDRAGAWKPSAQSQAAAKQRLASREAAGGGTSAAAAKQKIAARGGDAAVTKDKIAARSGNGAKGVSADAVGAKLANGKPPPRAKAKDSAFTSKGLDAGKTRKATDRGDLSVNKSKAKAATHARPKSVSRSSSHATPQRSSGAKSSAFKQHSSGGRASAASNRGSRSAGGHGGGGGGGRGGGRR